MRILGDDLKCVAFVCEERSGEVVPVATCFLVLFRIKRQGQRNHGFYYWVTAEHVINNICQNPILRINRKYSPPFELKTKKSDWRMHLDSDIAVMPFDVSDEIWESLDVAWIDTALFVTSDYKRPDLGDLPPTDTPPNIDLGDNVIFFGLFAQHHGHNRNLPIVRFGTIARMPTEEKIEIEIDAAPTKREVVAYLTEARSWGGQSGSPALWTAEFTFKPKKPDVKPDEKTRKRVSALLGLVSSHFDFKQKARTKNETLEDITTSLNTGIAVVVPAHAIDELIKTDSDLVTFREAKLAASTAN